MKTVSELFEQTQAPEGLAERVLAKIALVETASAKQNRMIWGVISGVSAAVFIVCTVYAVRAYSGSSFASYFSLIFSDLGSISLWWKELGLSLLESLPIFGTFLLVGSIFLVLWSGRKFAKHTGTFISISHARTA